MAAWGLNCISLTMSGVRNGVTPRLVWGRQSGVAIDTPSLLNEPTRTPEDVTFSKVKLIIMWARGQGVGLACWRPRPHIKSNGELSITIDQWRKVTEEEICEAARQGIIYIINFSVFCICRAKNWRSFSLPLLLV